MILDSGTCHLISLLNASTSLALCQMSHTRIIRALLKPEKFEKIPARAHPPPRLASKYPGHAEAIELAAKDRQISKGLPRSL